MHAEERSQAIDRALEEDAKVRKTQTNVLPLGAFSMRDIAKQLKNNDETGLTENELIDYRYNIHQCVVDCIKTLVHLMKSSEAQLEEDTRNRYSYLCDFIAVSQGDAPLNEEAGRTIGVLWKDPSITDAFQSSADSDLKEPSTYFFREIGRIAASNYVPTEADIVQSHKGIRGISEHRFNVNGLSINLIDVGTQRCERRKWIRQFDNVAAILFVVDLPCYDQEASGNNAMAEQIELFDNVVNTEWFTDTEFILFLNNISAFRQKLSHKPLGNYFPDYSGGTDAEKASGYLLQRFSQVNRGKRRLYSHLVDPHIASNIELVATAINDSSH
ncbi:G protein alpha subunit [Didymella exigua CBS 183.55]|uniref:G protein alpha subunit n=1 Tax=Didymella exigua CBS 183.55 TaxID=1150837 RepID=A0A6A5S2Q4_9PLEO|nr:G protein alpha subunit [Didymella exigua CBS 183.55]KAF1934193.1 G protein alpha subunit [Didymella exigua CBS 183.55]